MFVCLHVCMRSPTHIHTLTHTHTHVISVLYSPSLLQAVETDLAAHDSLGMFLLHTEGMNEGMTDIDNLQ